MTRSLILAAAIFLAGCSDGPLTTPNTAPLVPPDHAYEIDTWAENSEVYEFTPRSHPGKSCVVFILDNLSAAAMQCFDKPERP